MSRRLSPPPLPDWQDHILRLLRQPGVAPENAAALRKWLGWRTLPPSYCARLQDIAHRTGLPDLADDFGSFGALR